MTSLSTTPLRCLRISLVEGTPLLVLGTPLALIRLATTLEALLAGALVGISEVSSLMMPLCSSGMCVNASFLQSVGGEGTLLMEGSLVGSQVVALLMASLGFHRKHIMYITLDCHTYHMCVCTGFPRHPVAQAVLEVGGAHPKAHPLSRRMEKPLPQQSNLPPTIPHPSHPSFLTSTPTHPFLTFFTLHSSHSPPPPPPNAQGGGGWEGDGDSARGWKACEGDH